MQLLENGYGIYDLELQLYKEFDFDFNLKSEIRFKNYAWNALKINNKYYYLDENNDLYLRLDEENSKQLMSIGDFKYTSYYLKQISSDEILLRQISYPVFYIFNTTTNKFKIYSIELVDDLKDLFENQEKQREKSYNQGFQKMLIEDIDIIGNHIYVLPYNGDKKTVIYRYRFANDSIEFVNKLRLTTNDGSKAIQRTFTNIKFVNDTTLIGCDILNDEIAKLSIKHRSNSTFGVQL